MKKKLFFLCTLFGIVGSSYGQKKNVLILLVDDLRVELGCYGNTQVKSPNIDKLATEGTKFTKAYCQQAICGPSRISLLTGLRPETLGIYDLGTRLRSLHSGVVSMPQLFKENNYKTISIGKVYHAGNDDQSNWTTYHEKGSEDYVNATNEKNRTAFEIGTNSNGTNVADNKYKDGIATDRALTELDALKKTGDNFLMVLGLTKPHLPFNAPKKYWDLYDRNKIVVPSRDRPKGIYINALTNYGELRGYGGIPAEGDLNDNLTKTLIHGYYASISYIDAQVGKVIKRLEDLDLRKNTVIVLMSDHGYKIGEYGSWNKHSNFEIDTRVPLIISRETSLAEAKRNRTSAGLVENIDIFATISDICGLEKPKMDGKSLAPYTLFPNFTGDNAAYSLYPKGSITGITVTDGKYRYTEWRNTKTQALGSNATELYDHTAGPIATENLAGKASLKEVQKRMADLLDANFPDNAAPFDERRNLGDNHSVKITSPADKASFRVNTNIKLVAAAPTNGTKVNFQINNNFYRSSLTAPFTVDWKPTTAGTYTIGVVYVNKDGEKTNSQNITVTITRSTAKEIESTKELVNSETTNLITVFPNPAKDEFTITMGDIKPATVTIFNLTGNVVYKAQTNQKQHVVKTTSTLPTGIYFIKIVDESNNEYTKKLMIE